MLKSYYFICLSFSFVLTEHWVTYLPPLYSLQVQLGGWLKVYTAPKVWEEALQICQRDGAVLASPLNKELSDALQQQMLQFGVNGNIFLGTHDLFSNGNFVSVEGVPMSDMDIKWGVQGNRADTEDCLTMSVDGSVYYSSCTDPLPFICYKKLDSETMKERGTYDNEHWVTNFPPHYSLQVQLFGWLKVYTAPTVWKEALLKCQRDGAVLASPLNKELSDALQQQMLEFGVNGNIFLGTHDLFSNGNFVSVEGVPMSDMDIKWGVQGNRADTEDCLTMSVDGSVYYSSCTDPLPFICYKKVDSQSMKERGTYDNEHARCESDYSFNFKAGGWLKLHTEPEAWEEALLICQRDGAVLASPLKKELSDALQLQMLQFGVNGNIFLGTHDLFSKGHFVSVEGVPLSDMDIKWGVQGNRADTEDCLTMSVDGSVHYSSCTDPLPFICYKKPDSETMNECGTYDNEYHLNKQTGSCYKIHLNKQTWLRAYSICKSEGGYLVILNDEEEVRIVRNMINISYDAFNVGLVAWGKERIWNTIHGDKFEDVYNKWNTGEPNNFRNRTEIRGVCLYNGKLNDFPEDMFPLVFVCEKSPQF